MRTVWDKVHPLSRLDLPNLHNTVVGGVEIVGGGYDKLVSVLREVRAATLDTLRTREPRDEGYIAAEGEGCREGAGAIGKFCLDGAAFPEDQAEGAVQPGVGGECEGRGDRGGVVYGEEHAVS